MKKQQREEILGVAQKITGSPMLTRDTPEATLLCVRAILPLIEQIDRQEKALQSIERMSACAYTKGAARDVLNGPVRDAARYALLEPAALPRYYYERIPSTTTTFRADYPYRVLDRQTTMRGDATNMLVVCRTSNEAEAKLVTDALNQAHP